MLGIIKKLQNALQSEQPVDEPSASEQPEIQSEIDNTPLIDKDIASELTATVGADTHSQLVRKFIGDANKQFNSLADSNLSNAALADALHKIAGSAAVFGALPLRNLILKAENALRDNNSAEADSLMHSIHDCWEKTQIELENSH